MRVSLALATAVASLVAGHPGKSHENEHDFTLVRRAHHVSARRGLEACADKHSYRALQERAVLRRTGSVELRRRSLLEKRVNPTGVGHNETDSRPGVDEDSDDDTVFGDSNICVLNPEGEVGPYYVKGELVRENVREDQDGVPIVIEGQFIDVETCEPLTDLYWDIWNCNATGVYSGLVAEGNGDANDESNIDNTFLRGIQKTDDDGVIKFESIFPGHYSGRATHHHMVAWINATVLPNNTLTSGTASHIGQLFWDQDLVNAVEATYPYNTNDIAITENADDRVISTETSDTTSDPFFSYVYLGDSLADGLFGWITIGVNTSATYSPSYSFEYTEDGGVELEEQVGSDIVNGGGGMSMTGMPDGASSMPSGMMPGNVSVASTSSASASSSSSSTTATSTTALSAATTTPAEGSAFKA